MAIFTADMTIKSSKRLNGYTFVFYGFVLAVLLMLSGGCTALRLEKENTQRVIRENTLLQQENSRLSKELAEKKALMAKLQIVLMKKQEEIVQLSSSRQGLAKEIASSTIRTPAASTKVETVAYLAEIATEIEAAKENSKPDTAELFLHAEKLMQESNIELEQGHFEQASMLAAQAMETVNRKQLSIVPMDKGKSASYEEFLAPVEMSVSMKSNIRTGPDKGRRAFAIAVPGNQIVALGSRGEWVKVVLADGRKGWIHYSLLSPPQVLDTTQQAQRKDGN